MMPDAPHLQAWTAMPAVTVEGHEKVRELAARIDFELPVIGGHCMCLGEIALRLDRGGKTLKKMTFHHGKSLRWCSLDMSAENFDLTESSRERLATWIEQNGGQALKDAREEANRIRQRIRDELALDTTSQPAESAPSE